MNAKNKRNATVQVEYLVHVQEIRPWPPSQSLRSLRSVVIHWENGGRNSGQTQTVAPPVVSHIGEGKIEFNEFFKLSAILQRDTALRSKDGEGFKKNTLEFNLHEPRRDKTLLLATAVVDLAECGILKEAMNVGAPMSSKRSFNNTCQPVLYVQLQPVENKRLSLLPKEKNEAGSVSESCSVTDDDANLVVPEKKMNTSNGSVKIEEALSSNETETNEISEESQEIGNGEAQLKAEGTSLEDIDRCVEEEEVGENKTRSEKVKHIKSVRSSIDSIRNTLMKMESCGEEGGALTRSTSFRGNDKFLSPSYRNVALEKKIHQLEMKIRMLEDELVETAAIEAALYSVPAEHTCSISKVHTPARRLSRLYINSCRDNSQMRRSGAAKTAVSGLVLVAKACGNDIPRLTFWLSNTVALRAIVNQDCINRDQPPSSLKWKARSFKCKEGDDLQVFMAALEKVEAWIFCRIAESIWWQVLTPHMQPDITSETRDQDQLNFALENWKDAFSEACQKLCPVRGEGNECGCLHILTRLIMEQCVARLDVAMFNAILRDSTENIPSDPVSDPISNSDVLPIPAAKSSFGAGALLKTTIGTWSRWLTNLFGIDEDDSRGEDNDEQGNDHNAETTFKSFHLLNELSDLMMLPKDMLLNRGIRNEVCPSFGPPLIKKILENFDTDEFCPDPVPQIVFKTLNSEDAEEDSISSVPCIAALALYLPPSPSSVIGVIGGRSSQSSLRRSGSLMLRKANTSDDELDELESPLDAVLHDRSSLKSNNQWFSKQSSAVRYQRLRDVWMNSE